MIRDTEVKTQEDHVLAKYLTMNIHILRMIYIEFELISDSTKLL